MVASGTHNRRERPAKPALTREGIVAAAVAVARNDGVEKMTMRRLAKELDTGPASLYVYLNDTDELHAAVLDELLGEVDLDAGTGDWRDRLWAVLSSYRDVLFAHPSLARVALVTRLGGPHYLALLESVLALLAEGGMSQGQAAWAVDLLLQLATSTAAEHGSRRERPGAAREQEMLVTALRTASPQTYPSLTALGEDLLSGPGPARTRWAFDLVLNGAFATPRPTL
jgi:AcrR family transcriptional regulator